MFLQLLWHYPGEETSISCKRFTKYYPPPPKSLSSSPPLTPQSFCKSCTKYYPPPPNQSLPLIPHFTLAPPPPPQETLGQPWSSSSTIHLFQSQPECCVSVWVFNLQVEVVSQQHSHHCIILTENSVVQRCAETQTVRVTSPVPLHHPTESTEKKYAEKQRVHAET